MSRLRKAKRELLFKRFSSDSLSDPLLNLAIETVSQELINEKHLSSTVMLSELVEKPIKDFDSTEAILPPEIDPNLVDYYRLRRRVNRDCVLQLDCPRCDMSYKNWRGIYLPSSYCFDRLMFVRWETIVEFNSRQSTPKQRYLALETSIVEDFTTL